MPAIYEKVFVLGSPKSREEAKVGGRWRRPQLGLSYLLAARHVITAGQEAHRLSDVALPAAYLQRHALEVELKSWLAVVYDITRSWAWLTLLKVDPEADPPKETPVPFEHGHRELCSELQRALKAADWQDLPPSVVEVVDRVAQGEADAPERYRYDRVKVGKSKQLQDAFEQTVTIPVVDTQHALEDVFAEVFHFDNDAPEELQTWGTKLIVEVDALGQCIVQNYPSTWGD